MEVKSMAQARRKIKEAQAQANAERIKRERENVNDAAVIMVELGKIAAVDTWEAEQLGEVRVEAERRRDERRSEAAMALRRIQGRGEKLTAISVLVGAPLAELRPLTKIALPDGASADGNAPKLTELHSEGSAASDALGGAGGDERGGAASAQAGAAVGVTPEALGGKPVDALSDVAPVSGGGMWKLGETGVQING
jgi:hypothetical protein